MKASKKKVKKAANEVKKTTFVRARKEKRKQARKLKKLGSVAGRPSLPVPESRQAAAGRNKDNLADKAGTAQASAAENVERKRQKKAAAEKRQEAERKKRLRRENMAEEKQIKQLEKKLGFKSKSKTDTKTKKLPKSFAEDGLDYILDLCDPDKGGLASDLDDLESSDEGGIDDGGESDNPDESGSSGETDESEDDDDDVVGKDEEMELDEDVEGAPDISEESDDGEEQGGFWEDIYGRTRDSKGNVVHPENKEPKEDDGSEDRNETQTSNSTKSYVPPALRGSKNGAGSEDLVRLKKQLKGLLNRLAEGNMHVISRQVEDLYARNSRNNVSTVLAELLSAAVALPSLTPERLVLEHALLVAILHANVGPEVGASILQDMVVKLGKSLDHVRQQKDERLWTKEPDNYVGLVSQFYAFKVVGDELVFDILEGLAEGFSVKDVELIIVALRNVGFLLRKDSPQKLKALIQKIQLKAAANCPQESDSSRVRFMLDMILAIKNNNVKKMPNYDPTLQVHLTKAAKTFYRPDVHPMPLRVTYKDLTEAGTRGRWWLVGSAWSGNGDNQSGRGETEAFRNDGPGEEGQQGQAGAYTEKLLEAARKLRMNTDSRRDIFCCMMSACDYLEASERLCKLSFKSKAQQKEREAAFVILACCLKEKTKFNPFYVKLAGRLAAMDRKYRIALQFATWDRVKEVAELEDFQIRNLAAFIATAILEGTLPFTSLKIIEFADLNKPSVKLLKAVLSRLLDEVDEKDGSRVKPFFAKVAGDRKLNTFRDGVCLFMRHFMLRKTGPGPERDLLERRIRQAETFMGVREGRVVM